MSREEPAVVTIPGALIKYGAGPCYVYGLIQFLGGEVESISEMRRTMNMTRSRTDQYVRLLVKLGYLEEGQRHELGGGHALRIKVSKSEVSKSESEPEEGK